MISRRVLMAGAVGAFLSPPGLQAAKFPRICGQSLSNAALRSSLGWDRAYRARWGEMGRQTLSQIHTMIHAKAGRYDDSQGVFSWIVHYWLRAWVKMAQITHDAKYMEMCVSLIDYIIAHTDEARIERREITENYSRDPAYFRGTGRGGPFWKRGSEANALDTGQIAQGILHFTDAVFSAPEVWSGYQNVAKLYFRAAKRAVDAFDNDWQKFRDKGAYHYRDSQGSGQLGVTRTAFNQSATMMRAQLLINKWQPEISRGDKISRLAQYWIDDFAVVNDDGTIQWPYILHPKLQKVEDVGHASVDLDFLVPAFDSGLTALTLEHMRTLARTFLVKVYNGNGDLNANVDGTTFAGFNEHWNAGIGWFELSRFDKRVAQTALTVFNKHYGVDTKPGVLWSRPMLGWANLLETARACG